MTPNIQLLSELQLALDCNEAEITPTLIALITAAVHDVEPPKNLSDLCKIASDNGGTEYLDPLDVLPILLPCNNPGAVELMSIIASHGSAKEVILAVQEAAERLGRSFEDDFDESEMTSEHVETKPGKQNTCIQQLKVVIDLYAAVIPRVNLRRKTASQMIEPLFKDLKALLKIAGPRMSKDEARSIIRSSARLSCNVYDWVISVNQSNLEERNAGKITLIGLVDCVSRSCVPNIQASIAQRTFEECLSRFVVKSAVGVDWEVADMAISELLDVYKSLGVDLHAYTSPVTVAHLLATAYQPASNAKGDKMITFLFPVLLSSFQTNTFLDESLAILLRFLHAWSTNPTTSNRHLSPDVSVPLSGMLATVASAHANPLTRHQTFRALSLLLASSEPRLRFQHLAELTGQSEFPQMRIASVGLVKEYFLKAFNATSLMKDDPFFSPMFLRTFGPTLFRPNPPDLFGVKLELDDLQDNPELARLSECLSLYLLILCRDAKNLTGIRDKDMLKTIEVNLLEPIRETLARWMKDSIDRRSHLHDMTPLALLSPALERIDDAKSKLMS